MIGLFKKAKVFTRTEEEERALAACMESVVNEAVKARKQLSDTMAGSLRLVDLLSRIRECYPHVFDECVSSEEIKDIRDHYCGGTYEYKPEDKK